MARRDVGGGHGGKYRCENCHAHLDPEADAAPAAAGASSRAAAGGASTAASASAARRHFDKPMGGASRRLLR